MKNLFLLLILALLIPLSAKAQGVLLLEYKIDTPTAGYEITVYERNGVGEIYTLKQREHDGFPKLNELGFERIESPTIRNLTEGEVKTLKEEIMVLKKESDEATHNVEFLKDAVINGQSGDKFSGYLRVYTEGPTGPNQVIVREVQAKPKKNPKLVKQPEPKPQKVILLDTLEAEQFYMNFLKRIFQRIPEQARRAGLTIPEYDGAPGRSLLEWCRSEMPKAAVIVH